MKFVPSAQNPTGKPDYEGNTYKYWHAGQNNSGWNYVSLVLHLAPTPVQFMIRSVKMCGFPKTRHGRFACAQNQSRMHLLDVYPELIASYRTLIFNGDFDACVPYLHNERWTQHLADEQGWKTTRQWQAWQMDEQVAGYLTSFGTSTEVSNFTFAT